MEQWCSDDKVLEVGDKEVRNGIVHIASYQFLGLLWDASAT